MKTTLERVARALCSLDGLPENIKFEGRPMWESFLSKARVALQAIRDPSPAVTIAGSELLGREEGNSIDEHDMIRAWRVMIDAALSERP